MWYYLGHGGGGEGAGNPLLVGKGVDMVARKKDDPEGPFSGPLEFVERPMSSRAKWPVDDVLRMLAKTLENGQAVRLPVAKVGDLAHLQMAIRYGTTKKLGAKLRYKLADQHTLIVWAEKAK